MPDTTELATLREAARRALVASPRYREATRELNVMVVARMGPMDLDLYTASELDDLILWAGGHDVTMPAHLRAYLDAVKERGAEAE